MKKLILICSCLLASFVFTSGFANSLGLASGLSFANNLSGQACTPGTSTFCACYKNDLCQGTNCNVKGIIHSMQVFKNAKYGNGIPGACAFGCAVSGDTSAQCVTDCVNDTNYYIGNC
jgi:hypothetical protein